MQGQYLIVAAVVIFIVLWQIKSYFQNRDRIRRLSSLFPEDGNLIVSDIESVKTIYIQDPDVTDDFRSTIDDINAYLKKNQNKTTDYHIIKEIVNRNSQDAEEEVDTMLSAPLYLGLMATIAGVAIGVVFFALNDLGKLLAGNSVQINGIRTLLIDIGIAMVASFLGVLFTKISTSLFKDARSIMSCNKNKFLTWIQTELMPNLSDDITGALIKMTQDLNEFNSTFASNTKELKETLALVTESYKGQAEILNAIDKLKVNKIAKANIEVYDRLQGCTDEIEKLFDHLGKSEEYINSVVALNQQIGSIEERTRVFEEVGNYFKNEIEYVKDRQGLMRQQMSSLDSILQEAMSNLGESVGHGILELSSVFQRQNQSVQSLIEEQQNSLIESLSQQRIIINQKMDEMSDPFAGLRDTFAEIGEQTRHGIENISSTFEQQNQAISLMLTSQREAIEREIIDHRAAIEKELCEIPNQFNSLSQISQSVNKLASVISEQQENMIEHGKIMSELATIIEKDLLNRKNTAGWIKYAIMVGACGSFLLLLTLLIVQLFSLSLY